MSADLFADARAVASRAESSRATEDAVRMLAALKVVRDFLLHHETTHPCQCLPLKESRLAIAWISGAVCRDVNEAIRIAEGGQP